MARVTRVKDERVWNLAPSDVAGQLGRHVKTVRRWMNDGLLDYWQMAPGGPKFTCQEAVNEFVHKHMKKAS